MARRLAPEEKALWGRVMATVQPLHKVPPPTGEVARAKSVTEGNPQPKTMVMRHVPLHHASHGPPPHSGVDRNTLDSK
jgi:hypothetical protein